MQMDKKTKIVVLSVVAVVIIALVVILAVVLTKDKDDDVTPSNPVSQGEVVSINESEYSQQVAVMTPTDAVSVIGKWVLTGIQTAEGGDADVVAVIGREIMTTDMITFLADGSFMNHIGGLENKDVKAITGLYTVNGDQIALTYGNGATATATFDTVNQILKVDDGAYTYTLLRAF